MALVDQQKIRRSRTGLIAHDPARAQAGYTLFAPMLGDGTVFLVDMDGKVAHTWRPPFRPGLYGYMLDNGHLFYGGKVMDDLGRFEAWPRFKGGAVDVFMTRLHVSYDAASFPEDLVFQETADRASFQGRYVRRHPWKGEARCEAAERYRETLRARHETESATLASLTGWSLDEIRRKNGGDGRKWWEKLYGE